MHRRGGAVRGLDASGQYRPLYDDGAENAAATTRDYVLKLEHSAGSAPLLNIFGGKITTYRKLAEAAIAEISSFFPHLDAPWTANSSLPGGDFAVEDVAKLIEKSFKLID